MNSIKLQDRKVIHRKLLHFYTLRSEKEIKGTISFTTVSKRIKCLGINLLKETKYIYFENYKVLMKEIKDDINWLERCTMILDSNNEYCENGYAIQCNLQIQYNSYQIINGILDRIKTKKLQFVWKHKIPKYPMGQDRKSGDKPIHLCHIIYDKGGKNM